MALSKRKWISDHEPELVTGEPRYFIGGEENGTWSVYDKRTNLPAVISDELLIGLTFDVADNMVELLNQIEEDSKPGPQIE